MQCLDRDYISHFQLAYHPLPFRQQSYRKDRWTYSPSQMAGFNPIMSGRFNPIHDTNLKGRYGDGEVLACASEGSRQFSSRPAVGCLTSMLSVGWRGHTRAQTI